VANIYKVKIAFEDKTTRRVYDPPKIALIALFSDEVRSTCSKIPWNLPLVQMINYQSNLRFTINIFSGYIFEPIYNLIKWTNLFEAVIQVKSRLLDV